ncbi:MAG TPA: DNA polymerase III subunit delta' [Polyangiaceae bacterium]|nr:DNA polymerase III subunit delta' [Polyangiaceae bacterium]
MPFDSIRGQTTAVETLTRALKSGVVHHAYRFEGLDGVGKGMAATAFAQAMLCTGGDPLGCGRCDACRRVARVNEDDPRVPLHPDVIYLGRALYPSDIIGKKEAKEISVEQVRRLVLSRAAYAPHEGPAQIFIVWGADELSNSAANALLKTLEEPRSSTHFVLITSRPDKLLDTIRSRSLPVRFGPLGEDDLSEILRERGIEAPRIAEAVEIAGGSASVALEAADEELSARRTKFVATVMKALDAPDMGDAIRLAESVDSDRRALTDDLRALAAALSRRVRREVASDPAAAERNARRYELVLDAIDSVERNGSASLVIASLVGSLRHTVQRRPGDKPPIVLTRR